MSSAKTDLTMAVSCSYKAQLLLVLAWIALTASRSIDPCDPTNHAELDEPHRSTGYETGYPEKPLCDMHLAAGWYRFTSQAGGQMPTSCPKRLKCGSVVPVWMQGTHPTYADGVVMRKACANFETGGHQSNPCCEHAVSIAVRNCGPFFIYYLRPTPSCPMAYCAGTRSPCPVGKWSPTMFPPCKDAYPLMKTPPIMDGPNIHNNKTFDFRCKIDFPHQDPDQRFEVVWTFDRKTDPNLPSTIVSDPVREAILDGSALKGHINTNVGCQVRTFYESQGKKSHASAYLRSNIYYAGIMMNPTRVVVGEKDSSKQITLTSTIPILCDHDVDCCLVFKLDIDHDKQLSIPTRCDYSMCKEDWDPKTRTANINVPLFAKQDMIDDGPAELLAAFETLLPSGGGPYQEVFTGHTPDKLPIKVEDEKTSTCTITGDPHFHGHDFAPYHLFKTGDFTVYEVPTRDFQVQIRTWPCNNGKVTCICGVTIRERNDIVKVNQCDQPYGGPHTSPTVDTANKLSDGTIVQRSTNGRRIGVYLPSGSEIKINAHPAALNLYITTPGSDRGMSRGLCGTNDGNRNNEFMHPDGTVDKTCSPGQRCLPNNFFESWRSAPANSLFESVPPILNYTDDITYCACTENLQGQGHPAINCTSRGKVVYRNTACTNCPTVTNSLVPSFLQGNGWTKRSAVFQDQDMPDTPYVQKDLAPVDVSKLWPNGQGVTEAQARAKCTRALHASKLWTRCHGVNDLATVILEDCMLDILYGDSTDLVDMLTDQFTSECQMELAKDPANYVTNSNGDVIVKPELLTDICPRDCEEHGHCGTGGKCVCDKGWEGESRANPYYKQYSRHINPHRYLCGDDLAKLDTLQECHIMSNKGPQLDKIRSGPLCDTQHRPCQRMFVDASNLDLSDHLVCKIQPVDDQGHPMGKVITTSALFLSSGRIACDLPKTKASAQDYLVSASNNGHLYGNQVSIRVFDSRCLTCDTTNCTEKSSACHINNRCYDDQQENHGNSMQHCDVTKNTTQWTDAAGLTYKPTLTGPNADFLFECQFTPPVGVTGSYKVTWYLDGKEKHHQTLAPGSNTAFISSDDASTSGKMTCRLELNGAFSDSNVLDYVKS